MESGAVVLTASDIRYLYVGILRMGKLAQTTKSVEPLANLGSVPKAHAFTRGKDFSEPVVTQRQLDRAFNPTRF